MFGDYLMRDGCYRSANVDGLKLNHTLVEVPGFQGDHPTCEKKLKKGSGNLIIADGIFPQWHDDANDEDGELYGYSKWQIQKWKESCRQIHEKGYYVFVQLFSSGKQGEHEFLEGYNGKDLIGNFPNLLSTKEIQLYTDAYVKAAKASMLSGADGVELHGASGYLLGKFLSAKINRRTDEYGGTIVNRAKFILEVVDAVVKSIGASKVGIRLSPSGEGASLIAQYSYLLGQLERRAAWGRRLAYIHLEESPIQLEEDQFENFGGSHTFIYSIWRGVVIKGHSVLNTRPEECDETLVVNEELPQAEPNWQSQTRFHSSIPLECLSNIQ